MRTRIHVLRVCDAAGHRRPSFAVASAWPFAQGTLETQPILQFGLPYIQKLKIGMTHAERCTFWSELSDSLFDIADVQTMALETASSRR